LQNEDNNNPWKLPASSAANTTDKNPPHPAATSTRTRTGWSATRPANWVRWGDQSIHLEVAQAAKKQYPQEAIRIFTRESERFFDYRNRDSYSQGALCIREVRDIHRQLNDMESWIKQIAEIRERYKKLPALQDELNKLKL
jgi:hypothetical protein